jgi:glycosyltransferase involved in cell wall biosynthesis
VKDGLDSGECAIQRNLVADVGLNELCFTIQIGRRAMVVDLRFQVVQDADVVALGKESVNQMTPDEAGTTCYENVHGDDRPVCKGFAFKSAVLRGVLAQNSAQMRRRRIVFLAAHLLSPTIASGGDVLFCEIASRLRTLRPDWEIAVVAPDFCAEALQRYFDHVATFETRGEGRQGSPLSVAHTWLRRLSKASRALRLLSPELVHSTGDFFVDVLPASFAKRRLGSRWTGSIHHVNAPPHRRRNDFIVATASFALQRLSFAALKCADALTLLNEGVRAELARLGFDRRRLNVVGAGVDLDRFPLIPPNPEATHVVWLNRLEPTKGLFDLPAILSRLPPETIVDVIGSGPQGVVDRLKRALEEAGLSRRCVLHGYVHHDALQSLLARAAVFISCSYEEGWGISIAEALSSGIPCITYDLPSHREIFGDLITRVPLGDTTAFAAAVCEQLTRQETAETRAGRRAAMERFSLDACARRQEQVLEPLMVANVAAPGLV